jgi:chromosome segregation and condensation protein ScpB
LQHFGLPSIAELPPFEAAVEEKIQKNNELLKD